MSQDPIGPLVASGEASVFNMRCIDHLVKEGRAKQHSFNGYPNRYTVPAEDFVPFIIDGPPVEDWGPNKGFNTNINIRCDKLLALPPDHVLTIDVWDQSGMSQGLASSELGPYLASAVVE